MSFPIAITCLLLNNTTASNTPPTAPSGLNVSLIQDGVALSWSAASEAETIARGLTYNVRVTGPGGSAPDCVADAAQNRRRFYRLVWP